MSDNFDNVVTLVVNGKEYGGWKSVAIQAGIERVARSFNLGVTTSWPGAKTLRKKIQPYDSCEVYVGNDLVLTGNVDARPISYDASQVTVSVGGRSKTARLADCAAVNEPGQWSGSKVEDIANALAGIYGVKVRANISTGAPIDDHQILQGETAFESIDRMLQLRQLLATDTARGDLLLTEASTQRSGEALVLGENILTGSAPQDFSEVYSEYICKGQRSSTEAESDDDESLPDLLTQTVARASDADVPYRRTTIIKQSGQADEATCQDRVNFERNYRRARAMAAAYSVQGWRRRDGKLWMPNEQVRVTDDLIGFANTDLLIVELEYRLDESGTITTLNVAPRAGYVKLKSQEKTQMFADVVSAKSVGK